MTHQTTILELVTYQNTKSLTRHFADDLIWSCTCSGFYCHCTRREKGQYKNTVYSQSFTILLGAETKMIPLNICNICNNDPNSDCLIYQLNKWCTSTTNYLETIWYVSKLYQLVTFPQGNLNCLWSQVNLVQFQTMALCDSLSRKQFHIEYPFSLLYLI
jgi:hypothetical protein